MGIVRKVKSRDNQKDVRMDKKSFDLQISAEHLQGKKMSMTASLFFKKVAHVKGKEPTESNTTVREI